MQVYSASLDGTVRLWDFQAGTLLSVHGVNAPIKSLVSLAGSPYREQTYLCMPVLHVTREPSLLPTKGNATVQVVPAQGVHAYVVTAHATGQNKGRVMRLNTSTGALDPRAFSTSKPRPLAVSILKSCSLVPGARAESIPADIPHALTIHEDAGILSRLNSRWVQVDAEILMACMQVSEGGGYVSTVDKHTVHVWSTKQPEWPSLKLHSSKALTASHLT